MLSCTGKRSHRHTILHVSFSNSFGLASARPTPQGLSGAPFVLNGVGEIKILIPLLEKYKAIHCYLDNDNAGKNATKSIMNAYGSKVIDESYRYREYNDLNDCLMAMHR